MGFMQGYESGKDKWYKLPLVGVLPQASFRLTTADRGWNPSSGSMPSTPPIAATATAPCRGFFRRCDAAMLGKYRCVGSASLVCCHPAPAAHLAAGWWHRNLGTKMSIWWGSGLHRSWNRWTGGLVPTVSTPQCRNCAMMNHQPHADMSDVAAEAVVSALLPF